MNLHRRIVVTAIVLFCFGAAVGAQGAAVTPSQVRSFIGTWVFTMTEPEVFKGSQQTVRIWEKNGVLVANIQVGKFPPNPVTGIFKDGNMLVLTVGHHAQPQLTENGAPLWAVISLELEGDTMRTAQMLERSQTIKRGIGRREPQ